MKKRIFVVEDEALVAMELKDKLKQMGYEVCGHAAHAAQALRDIPETRPDLVLMDINLGRGPSGLDVVEGLPRESTPPVIFLTAYCDKDLTERAVRSGSFSYVIKPFDWCALGANIQMALTHRGLNDALRRKEADQREFVADVTHELRTPLTIILNSVSDLLEEKHADPKERRNLMTFIESQARRLNWLVDKMLELTSLEDLGTASGAAVLVGETAARTIEGLGPVAARKRIVLSSHIPADLACGLPAQHLQMILDNLLSNALKYTQNGGKVRIDARAAEGRLELIVTDNGPGLAPHHLDRVFDRFFRAASAVDSRGSGLGLSIVRRIAEQSGGRAWVESRLGHGAAFHVTLPLSPRSE